MAAVASPSRHPALDRALATDSIDDIIYRVSAEFDRGTPAAGLYARDGLWDDDDTDTASTARASSRAGSSAAASGGDKQSVRSKSSAGTRTRASSSAGTAVSGSSGGRHRSDTASGGGARDEFWTWGRKSMSRDREMPSSPAAAAGDGDAAARELRKKASKSKLKGKGRRGELTVHVNSDHHDTLASPALTTASTLVSPPTSFVSHFDSPQLEAPIALADFAPSTPSLPAHAEAAAAPTVKKSSWKRGMERLFKSKSSSTLRDAYRAGHGENVPPPLPALPRATAHADGPYSPTMASFPAFPFPGAPATAPLGESRFANGNTRHYPAPPPRHGGARGHHAPALPRDPFASSLDLNAHVPPHKPLGKAPRSSPSLRDLKAALHLPGGGSGHKPKLSKAKSLANIRAPAPDAPLSAPMRTNVSSPPPAPKRLSQACGTAASQMTPASTQPLSPPTRPRPPIDRRTTDSPPLQPPRPHFLGRAERASQSSSASTSSLSTSSSTPALTISTDVSPFAATPASPGTPAPQTPLPPLPVSSSAPATSVIAQSPVMQRSLSGAVVLPRSRSASLSLKGPPTSSSFFDLYEQLGIWPGVNDAAKDPKDTTADAMSFGTEMAKSVPPEHVNGTKEGAEVLADGDAAAPATTGTVSQSPSATFSLASWEAAIGAFPLVDNADTSLAYDDADTSILSSLSNVAVASSCGHTTITATSAASTANPQAATSSAAGTTGASQQQAGGSSSDAGRTSGADFTGTYYGMSRRSSGGAPGGSGGSSRAPSRNRQAEREGGWFEGSGDAAASDSESGGSDSEPDADDVPLSQLHPQAAAAQRIRQADAALRRELRRTAGGRDRERGRTSERQAAKARREQRNPGAAGWDGEGGVPADLLTSRLERLAMAFVPPPPPARDGADRSARQATLPLAVPQTRPLQIRPHQRAQTVPVPAHAPEQPVAGPSRVARQTSQADHGASRADTHGHGHAAPHVSRKPVSVAMEAHGSGSSSASGARRPDAQAQPSQRTRSRAVSNAATTQRPADLAMAPPMPAPAAAAVATSPVVPLHRARPLQARCRVRDGREVQLDVYADTVARDVLAMARSKGDIADVGAAAAWVVCEAFVELGLERQMREYEPLQAAMRGWDASSSNHFVLRESNRAVATLARAVPTTPPFFGAYVQHETKKGKWSKRWLETRGGQVFLSKNDKDEVHINTQFVDVYSMAAAYAAPKPFVFALKRHEPAAAFEDRGEHVQMISCEDATGWKLLAAIYDAKSFTLAQTQPHLLATRVPAPAAGDRPVHVNKHGQVRPQHAHAPPAGPAQPLVDLKRGDRSAFTGKGLLKI